MEKCKFFSFSITHIQHRLLRRHEKVDGLNKYYRGVGQRGGKGKPQDPMTPGVNWPFSKNEKYE